jgi:hypothetical protein
MQPAAYLSTVQAAIRKRLVVRGHRYDQKGEGLEIKEFDRSRCLVRYILLSSADAYLLIGIVTSYRELLLQVIRLRQHEYARM